MSLLFQSYPSFCSIREYDIMDIDVYYRVYAIIARKVHIEYFIAISGYYYELQPLVKHSNKRVNPTRLFRSREEVRIICLSYRDKYDKSFPSGYGYKKFSVSKKWLEEKLKGKEEVISQLRA